MEEATSARKAAPVRTMLAEDDGIVEVIEAQDL